MLVFSVRVVEVIRRVIVAIGFDKLSVVVAKGILGLFTVLAIGAVAGFGGSNRGRRGAGGNLHRGGSVHSRGALAYQRKERNISEKEKKNYNAPEVAQSVAGGSV